AASAAQPTPAAAKEAAPGGADRQKVALVFLQAEAISAVEVQEALQPFHGQLAHLGEGRCACAFTHRAGENPGQRALGAARLLLERGLGRRAIVDVGAVVVKARPGGPPRLLGAILTQPDRYPAPSDPEGITVTAAARALLPEATRRAAERSVRAHATALDERTRTVLDDTALPLFGRDRQVRALVEEARQAAAERKSRAASVIGEPGAGKTHLGATLIRRLRDEVPGARVLALQARAPLGNDSDQALAELLRQALELPGEPPLDGG